MIQSKGVGKVTEVRGPVIDARFEKGKLPRVNDALRIKREGDNDLILEVAHHLGDEVVLSMAVDSADGLARGVAVVIISEGNIGKAFKLVVGIVAPGSCYTRRRQSVAKQVIRISFICS